VAGSTGYIKFSYEGTGAPGNESVTPSPSTKSLYPPVVTFNSTFNPSVFTRDDEIRGINEAISVLPDQFNPTLQLTVPAYPDTVAFFLKACTDGITTTAGDGVITDPDSNTIPNTATRHVFVAPGSQTATGAVPVTMRVQAVYKDQPTGVVAYEARGCAVTSVAFAIDGAKVMLTVAMTPNYYARVSDPSLTPSYEDLATIHPFRESQITIPTWLASTEKNESGGFDFTVTKPVTTHRTMGIASLYPDYIDKGDGMITVTGNISKRYLGTVDWDAFTANTGFATKVKYANDSTVLSSGYHYAMWLETTNTQYISGDPDDLTNTRNLGATYGWQATNNTGTAGSWKITIVNETASYA
jgi:hypothetical protein